MQQPCEKSSLNASTSASESFGQHHSGNRHRYPDLLCSSYPSPPMSRPTTPAHEGPEKRRAAPLVTDLHSGQSENIDSASQPILSLSSSDTTRNTEILPSTTSATVETNTISASVADSDRATSAETSSVINTTSSRTISDSNQIVAGSSSIKSTRKAKQHVASACVNCKRAHLSCDVRRPCQRCINTGKQDSCHDVQHKKRGRPRLREDTDIMLPSSSVQPLTSTITPQTQHRPIASTRSRRAESFRSHQSRGSESSSYGPVTPNSATFSPLYAPYQFTPGSILPAVETPTALLDLDLRVLRFNTAFQQIVGDGRSLLSVRLSDVVRPLENSEPLLSMRDRLRIEREQREPAFLPPIVQSGRDPLDSVQDSDIDRLTQGFSDVTYTWMFQTPSSPATAHPVRVRLGKALTYFVAVTLQPMQVTRSTILHTTPAHLAMSTPVAPDMYAIDRQSLVPAAGLVYDQVLFTSPRTTHYATTNIHQHSQQQPQYPILIQPIPSQHITSMPTDVAAQHPQIMQQGQPFIRLAADPRSLMNYRDQLPPIAETTAGASRPTTTPAQTDELVVDDEDVDDQEQTAKRRRGMGIDDVLQ